MTLYYFYDDGAKAGLGHYRRIRLLAQKIKHITTHQKIEHVFCPISTYALQHLENLHTFCANIHPQQTLGAIVDSYIFEAKHFALLDSVFPRLLCLDDENRNVYPPKSFILNGALNAHKLYPHHDSQYMLGIDFALCDEIFTPIPLAQEKVRAIFVSFGGSDQQNFSTQILPCIQSSMPSCTIHLVLGQYYTHLPPTGENLICHNALSAPQMQQVMQQCDIAISAGGGTLIELAQSLIPTIMIESALNQHFQITQFATLGAFKHAKSLAQIPKILQSLAPKSVRQSIKNTLATLHFGQNIQSALRNIFGL